VIFTAHTFPLAVSSPVFGPREVYAPVDGSATVKCFYPPTTVNRHDRKYWCKQSGSSCVTIASTSGYIAAEYKGRISITDHPEAESFQIDISALGLTDVGTYRCGVGLNGKGLSHKVILTVSQDSSLPEAPELFYMKQSSSWSVTCKFGEESADLRRYLCKMEKEECRTIIDTHQNVAEDFTGRVLLSYGGSAGSFSVTVTQLDGEDSGVYHCGVGEYGKEGHSKELDVFVYEDTKLPQVNPTVTAKAGTSATFECHYDPLKRSSTRIWCKWRKNGCAKIIDNTGNVMYGYEGRVAMFENPDSKTVTVILNQLKESDKGYYWCMTNDAKEQQTSSELKIIDGEPLLTGKKEVEAQVGSRVDLTCSYPCNYYSYDKYWCKWTSAGCPIIPASNPQQLGMDATCNSANKTVVLSIDSVTEADEGWYWCGVKRNNIFGETMAVYLLVTGGNNAKHGPELLDVEAPNQAEIPNHVEPVPVPEGGAYSDAGVRSGAAPESSEQSHSSNTLALVLGPLAGLLLIIVTAFAIVKYRQMKRSDLVSIGSYRTNISMSDFESVKDYGASNNACVKVSQETPIGRDEFITTTETTTETSENTAEAKKAKRSSKEDADLAYSTFLLTSGTIAQASSGGDSAAQDMSPSALEDQVRD
ncbi:PREDICTED: polymeric immunoglobulin receptor, partial [Acanthisitta chloris]|uniref:polymeric immunoglobulin receptor n=1 Tax=Acanthisitta chloris TaxID=57068 RepID=UPI0004F0C650